jgi:hypothetical protein
MGISAMAKQMAPTAANRLRALARERGDAWAHEQLAAQEAEFQREADWRKQQSVANVKRWDAVRAARRYATAAEAHEALTAQRLMKERRGYASLNDRE